MSSETLTPAPADLAGKHLQPALYIAFVATVLAMIIPKGSVTVLPTAFGVAVFAVLAAVWLLAGGFPRQTPAAFALALALLAGLGAWIGLQSLSFAGNPFANPIWAEASRLLGPLDGAISIQPADTRDAFLYLAAPLPSYLAGLLLCPDDDRADRLLRTLAVAGGIVAVAAIVQHEAFPGWLLFTEKRHYLDSLTATFVNRNTAATYFGTAALGLFAVLVIEAKAAPLRPRWDWLVLPVRRRRPPVPWRILAIGLLFAAALTALFLTRSRGGVGSTFLAFLAITPLLAWLPTLSNSRRGFSKAQPTPFARLAKAAVAMTLVMAVGAVFAGRAAFRAEVQGVDDARFCVFPGIVDGIVANWPYGTGFGTFPDAFAAYRDPACGLGGVWNRAHNGYLEALFGLGLPGAIAIVVGVVGLLAIFVAGVRNRRSLRIAPIAGLGILVLLVAHSAVDFSLQIPGMAVYAAALLAALTTLSLGRRAESREKAPGR